MKLNKFQYRIVRDSFNGYEAQIRHFIFPVWQQLHGLNSFSSVNEAEEFINSDREVRMSKGGEVKRTIWYYN